MNEHIEKDIWDKFCKQLKQKLSDITDPVVLDKSNRSYDALSDVISNVLLFQINIDKKPWEEIPKKDVRLPTREQLIKDSEWMDSAKTIAEILKEKVSRDISYINDTAERLAPHTIASFGLYASLIQYIENYEKYDKR